MNGRGGRHTEDGDGTKIKGEGGRKEEDEGRMELWAKIREKVGEGMEWKSWRHGRRRWKEE